MILNKKNIIRLMGYPITAVSILYVGKEAFRVLYEPDTLSLITNNFMVTVLCIFLYLPSILTNCIQWKIILEYLGKEKIPLNKIYPVYAVSNIAKYLPGNVFQYASRNILGGPMGWKQSNLALSSLLEIILGVGIFIMLLIPILLGNFLVIPVDFQSFQNLSLPIIIIGLMVVILSTIFFKNKFSKLLTILFSKHFFVLFLRVFVFSLINYLMGGITLAILIAALSHTVITLQVTMVIVSAFIVSSFIGYITPGAPGGLGVREAILLFTLGNVFSQPIILISILIHRFIAILVDIIAYLVNLFYKRS